MKNPGYSRPISQNPAYFRLYASATYFLKPISRRIPHVILKIPLARWGFIDRFSPVLHWKIPLVRTDTASHPSLTSWDESDLISHFPIGKFPFLKSPWLIPLRGKAIKSLPIRFSVDTLVFILNTRKIGNKSHALFPC